jgi:hypothetical protein
MTFRSRFITTNAIMAALTRIERARGFLDAATHLSVATVTGCDSGA